MKFILIILTSALLVACAANDTTPKNGQWAYFETWDKNDDMNLDQQEFTSGYVSSDFFTRWNRKSNSISLTAYCDSVFQTLDASRDSALDSTELLSKRAYYMVGDSLSGITTSGNSLTKNEFESRICQEHVAKRFDKVGDQKISTDEMARALFEVCDFNRNDSISSLEFYLWQVYRN